MSQKSKAAILRKFLENLKPNQQDFIDLFDSIRFGAEYNDTATNAKSGLVKMADNDDIDARNVKDLDNYTLSVGPDNLPVVSLKAGSVLVLSDVVADGKRTYEVDDTALVALISAISVPANGAWQAIGGYTVGNTDNEFDEGWQNLGATIAKVRAIAHDQVEIKGKVQLTLADTSLINILQLASTYRPAASDIEFPAVAFSANNWSQEKVILKVLSTGKLTIEGIIPTNAIIPFHIIYTKT